MLDDIFDYSVIWLDDIFHYSYREDFAGFDANIVAKMDEQEIMEIESNKALSLADGRVTCIVDNAKCIVKVSQYTKSIPK